MTRRTLALLVATVCALATFGVSAPVGAAETDGVTTSFTDRKADFVFSRERPLVKQFTDEQRKAGDLRRIDFEITSQRVTYTVCMADRWDLARQPRSILHLGANLTYDPAYGPAWSIDEAMMFDVTFSKDGKVTKGTKRIDAYGGAADQKIAVSRDGACIILSAPRSVITPEAHHLKLYVFAHHCYRTIFNCDADFSSHRYSIDF